jgi:DNA-directed RNA polymerase subunit K/omega
MSTEVPTISMDELAVKVGGMFALVTLINMRTREIKKGSRPLVNESLKNVKDVVLKEISEGKISLKTSDSGDVELLYEDDDEFFLES